MTARRSTPLNARNATGNGNASTDDLIRVSDTVLRTANELIGAVGQLRTDVGDRLEKIESTLGEVCVKVEGIVSDRKGEAMVAAAAKENRQEATLSAQTRYSLALGAIGGLCGLVTAVVLVIAQLHL